MKRDEVLKEAGLLISGPRHEQYGDARDNFKNLADLWSIWIRGRFGVDIALEAEDVAMMQIMTKQARLANDVTYKDGWLDLVGYGALGGEIGTE